MTNPPSTDATPAVFLDRNLSWLEFNRRVLHEALDKRTPLLERVKFLAIFNSNLDEFFMKHVGALKHRIAVSGDGPVVESDASRRLPPSPRGPFSVGRASRGVCRYDSPGPGTQRHSSPRLV